MQFLFVQSVCIVVILGQGYAEEEQVKRFPTRTLARTGKKALKFLTIGATKLKTDAPRMTKYVKPGGKSRATWDVGKLDAITRELKPGTASQWKTLVTDQGTKYGKVVGNRFVEIFPPTKIYPPMVRVSKMRYRKKKKVTVLEEPVEIKYLTFSGGSRNPTINDRLNLSKILDKD